MNFKKCLAIVLSILFIICSFPMATLAEDTTESETQNIEISSEDISLSGTNSVGNMIAAELEEVTEQNQGSGNVVYSVEIELSSAYVEFSTAVSCTLFVGIYTEDATTLLSSGYTEVTPEDEYAFITLDSTPPNYFYVKAYLLDTDDYSPLSAVHNNAMYTEEMQEFLSKTTDDFEEEKVINFDDDKTNNFAVLSDDVLILNEEIQIDKVTTYTDNASQIYILENIDESVSSLNVGDTIAFDYNNEMVIVTIGEIFVDGTTATILGADAELEEVFDYVKIDDSTGITEDTVDETACGEGVTFEGYEDSPTTFSTRAIDIGTSIGGNAKFSIDFTKKGTDNINVTVSGNINLSFVFSPKLYIFTNYKYIELKFDYNLSGGVSVTGKVEAEIPIAPLKFGIPGVSAEIIPKLVVSVGGEISLAGTLLKGTLGYGWYSDVGDVNLCSTPKMELLEFKAEVTIFIGLRVDPEVKILEGTLAKTSIEANLGAEAKATGDTSDLLDLSIKHDCISCFDGEIYGKFDLSVKGELLKNEKWSLDLNVAEIKIKICDFYWSLTYNEFAFTTCPHISYKLNVMVSDTSGKAIKGATVSINDTSYTTTKNGTVSEFLPNGEYKIIATKEDLFAEEKTIYIKDDSKSLNITLGKGLPITPKNLSLGGYHSAIVTENGNLYMWGYNGYGQLGDGTTTDKRTPIKIMSDVVAVSLGYYHSGALTKNGDLYMWGYNNHGQLGDGTTNNCTKPQKIMSNVASFDLGQYFTAAITKSGDLYTWGQNFDGQLGDDTNIDKYIPQKIMSDVISIALGGYHCAAIKKDNSLYMWGSNIFGQLGDGTTNSKDTPRILMDNVASASLGCNHTSFVTQNGDLYMCGRNSGGQLGDGTTIDKYTPQKIMSNIKYSSLDHADPSTAVTKEGELYIWGYNNNGRLGVGTTKWVLSPQKIMSNVVEVSLGFEHSAAITNTGELYLWGYNNHGQLGDGKTTTKYTPQKLTLPEAVPLTLNLYNSAATSEVLEEKSFENLEPNAIYNFYIMKDKAAENALNTENLLYVNQGTTDKNGNISFEFMNTGTDFDNAEKFVVKFKNALPENIISNMLITASPQKIFLELGENNLLNNGYENIKAKITINNEDTYITEYSVNDGKILFTFDVPSEVAVDSVISVQLLADFEGKTYECKEYHHTFGNARCDVSADGNADLQDVTLSAKHLAGWGVSVNEQTLDTYGDGAVNLNDLVTLAQYVAGWDVELTANS